MSSAGAPDDSPDARLSPSDALASLCWAIHQIDRPDNKELDSWRLAIESEPRPKPNQEWAKDADAVLDAAGIDALRWPPARPTSVEELLQLIKAIEVLDRWHLPLNAAGPETPSIDKDPSVLGTLDHLAARVSFAASTGPLGGDANGIIIPRRTERSSIRLFPTHLPERPLLMDVLVYTAYLPRKLVARDANDEPCSVDLRYQRLDRTVVRTSAGRSDQAAGDDDDPGKLMISVAPLLETGTDAEWRLSKDKKRYGLSPTYSRGRLTDVINRAFAEKTNLLLLPEASVAESNLKFLQKAVKRAVQEHRDATGQTPPLLYVFAGVVASPEKPKSKKGKKKQAKLKADEQQHRNYVVLIDRHGDIRMEQDKMFPWDICHDQLDRFDMHRKFCLDASCKDPLKEDIAGAKSVTLMDLGDIGRVLNLICADMNYDLPGDYLLHLGVDWLNAPIFDQSIGSVNPLPSDGRLTWICKRAFRAASAGSRVMVSNSIALTDWLNDANKQRDGFDEINPCCVGLLAYRDTTSEGFVRLELALDTGSPMYTLHPWKDGPWEPLPVIDTGSHAPSDPED